MSEKNSIVNVDIDSLKKEAIDYRVYKPYIIDDFYRFPMNGKYPPDTKKYGIGYGGYATVAQQVLFYDFAVQGYKVIFEYDRVKYYLLSASNYAAVCDATFSRQLATFSHENELIERFVIKDKSLLKIMKDITYIESF